MTIPEDSTDREFQDDSADSEMESRDHLFGFNGEDKYVLDELITGLRAAITKPNRPAKEIKALARLILALECLPAPMDGLSIDFSVGRRYSNGELSLHTLNITEDEFRVGTCRYVILDPSIGGDTESETWFECQVGGYRYQDGPFQFSEWVTQAVARIEDSEDEIAIEDMTDEGTFDWDAEPDSSAWDEAPSEY